MKMKTILPVSGQYEVEEGCTHRCFHCYNGYFPTPRKSNPTNDDVTKVIANSEIFHLTLTGGEPLMSKDQLYRSMEILSKNNVDFGLNTNLHLLKEEDVKIMKSLGIQGILTSILGNEQTHDYVTQTKGSFKKLISSLEILANSGINVSANMVVENHNKNQVYQTGEMLYKRFGMINFCATPKAPSPDHPDKSRLTKKEYVKTLDTLLSLGSDFGLNTESLHPVLACMFDSKEEREKYSKFIYTRGCSAGRGTFTFSINGDVRACSHEFKVYGNILEESFKEIYNKMTDWQNQKNLPEECSPCVEKERCAGGCRVIAIAINGKENSKDPYMGNPILEKEPRNEIVFPDFKDMKISRGNFRVREEGDEIYTVFRNQRNFLTMNKVGYTIFRRFLAKKNFIEIKKELPENFPLENVTKNLFRGGLLE
jgi:radical SAM protein with 4Fe4S-binding SPASM domain